MNGAYDIVIAGGGSVGASLACALRHLPIRIALIEKHPQQQFVETDWDVRSFALSLSTQRILQGMGIWKNLAAHITPIQQIHVSQAGGLAPVRLRPQQFDVESLGFTIEVSRLYDALYTQIKQAKNIDLFCPATITQVSLAQPLSSLTLSTEQETTQSLTAKLIVGAEGSGSILRRSLQLKTFEYDYQQTAIATNIVLARDHQFQAFERFTHHGPLGILPLREKRCALIWAVPKARAADLLAMDDVTFLQQLYEQIAYRAGRLLQVGKRMTFPLKMLYTPEQIRAGFVGVGNTVHMSHPVAGQGFNLSLRDVALLAELLTQAIQQNKPISHLSVLQNYADARVRDQRSTLLMCDGLVKLFTPTVAPLMLARSLGMMAMDYIPALQRGLVRKSMGLSA